LSLPARPLVVAALALALAAGCGGGADEPGDGPPGPARNATPSTLLRASASSPSAAATGTATVTATATATPTPTVQPLVTRTPVPGCAQGATTPPAIYYGFGLAEGEVVMVFNTRPGCDQVVCEETVVDGDGFWVLRVAGDNVCGPRDGDAMVFTIDGEAAAAGAVWSAGLAPADRQRGISLRPE